jgi:RND family efflux transporter MFP subunit
MAAALVAGIVPRVHGEAVLQSRVLAAQASLVNIVSPGRAASSQELTLPADVRAYQDAAIHARVNGYLRKWYVDIGTPVKTGQLLAEIDAPEVADQLRQARADEQTAAANYALARTTAERWKDLQASNSVAQQETDQKVADMQAKAAVLASARSNTSRLAQMASYTEIRAPFDGVITARNVDAGALIDAGSAPAQGRELFHISAGSRLRVYVQVPQDAAAAISPGATAWLTLPGAPGEHYPATVTRTAGAIDPVTRSLRVELDVDSQNGKILPGAYAQAHIVPEAASPGLDLPASTLMFPAGGVSVAVVGKDGKVAVRKVGLGRDFGSHVEILSGLSAGDQVIVNPGDGLTSGTQVRVVPAAQGGKA